LDEPAAQGAGYSNQDGKWPYSGFQRDLAEGGSRGRASQATVQSLAVVTVQGLLPLYLAHGDTAGFQDLENGFRHDNGLSPPDLRIALYG
jgi:hypothetical protein